MPTAPHFEQVRSWLNEIHREKQAAAKTTVKSGKAMSETGGYVGETTHPVKDVDDGLQKAREGARSSENESDIKKMEPAGNVNETSDSSKTQDSLNYNIGTHQSATGEDPSVEDDYRSRMKDPGTSHPASMDVGEKYSAWVKKEANELAGLANEILADISTTLAAAAGMKQPAGQKTATATTPAPAQSTSKAAEATPPASQTDSVAAATAGYELAALLGLSKEAADLATTTVIADTIKQAQMGADRVGAYLLAYVKESEHLAKQAADPSDGDTGAGGGGGAPPGAEAAIADAAGDAGAGGAMMPPPGAEGGGGPPGAGGGGHEQALQELAMALMELGITPEELAQLAAQGGGGGGPPGAGGPPGGDPMAGGGADMMGGAGGPPGGGMPPGGGGLAEMGGKIASAVKDYKRSGRFEVRPAKTAAERAQRNEFKKYILEIVGASRG